MNEKEIYEENEIKANKVMAIAAIIIAGVLSVLFFLTVILSDVNVFNFTKSTIEYVKITLPIDIALLVVPVFFIKTEIIKKPWFKYCLIVLYTLVISMLNVIMPKDCIILWASIFALASLYFNPKFTIFSFILTIVFLAVSIPGGMLVGSWENNLMSVNQTQFATLIKLGTKDNPVYLDPNNSKDRLYWLNNFKEMIEYNELGINDANRWVAAFVFYFLPRALALTVIAGIGNYLSIRTKHILNEQIKETKHTQKMTSELSIATAIQAGVLPKEFPDSKYGEIYAMMDPAKEVGGDLYDFFPVNDNEIALVIGDASGKGVPASLFMMKAQSLVRSIVKIHSNNVGEVVTAVNNAMCEGNEMSMFVTCWVGIFNKETGVLRFANAGHNPPILKTGNEYHYLNAKPGLVLGGFSGFEYKETSVTLDKGDKLFLYTDGVTEAHNVRSELYGEERLINLIKQVNGSPFDTITKVREDIREYSRNTEQFDDITMLMIEYRKPKKMNSKVFEAKKENLEAVQDFILSSIKNANTELSMKDTNELLIVTEEIFINIASYSYEDGKGQCEINVDLDNDVMTLAFIDSGVKFDPLAKDDPNIMLAAEDRGIGGLGIFMVKKMMDKVYYEYKDNHNVLTMVKKYNKK